MTNAKLAGMDLAQGAPVQLSFCDKVEQLLPFITADWDILAPHIVETLKTIFDSFPPNSTDPEDDELTLELPVPDELAVNDEAYAAFKQQRQTNHEACRAARRNLDNQIQAYNLAVDNLARVTRESIYSHNDENAQLSSGLHSLAEEDP